MNQARPVNHQNHPKRRALLDDFVQSLSSLMHPDAALPLDSSRDAWRPATDIHQTDHRYLLEIELPGFAAGDINVEIDGDELTVQCARTSEAPGEDTGSATPQDNIVRRERHMGRFARHFKLPADADHESVAGRMEHGVLFITLDRISAQEKVTHIEVR